MGKGEAVVILPSMWLTSESYRSLAQKLSLNFRVIVPDLFRGDTKSPKRAKSIESYTDELKNLLEDLEIKKYSLIGLSFSGLIVVDYLKKYPGYLNKAVLVSSPDLTKGECVTAAMGFFGFIKLFTNYAKTLPKLRIFNNLIKDSIRNYFLKHPVQFFLDIGVAISYKDTRIENFPVPTKIFWADEDEFFGEILPNIENLKIPNFNEEKIKGHHCWFFDDEELATKKFRDCLK